MDVGGLLTAAAAGDQAAWNALVARFESLVWSIARGYRLSDADAGDAVQMTWLRLVENIDRIAEPDRLAAWLATTAKRECLQSIRRTSRDPITTDTPLDRRDPTPPAEQALLRRERDSALWAALAELGDQCRRLLRVLMAVPPPAYAEVAEALGMRIGSIGPTRRRCLEQLRTIAESDELLQERGR
ncbi:RNA polymerase sigma factor, sigma-70 family [Amycolatopsis xylanica]|uniref:RNA polymerase sigma factor, sigma-70 family n=1 Tax=Amycolatopsis xylanica TaxID=589385 RepID=A0A1H2W1L9_9PSEU|nr:sigma-70 family RNA polymerase sigma factor [Amycolatopsis xylanica]SDW74508.1 RNA polymerase sigma factor, sigma-70 family [Amycolatopsis xylanica]